MSKQVTKQKNSAKERYIKPMKFIFHYLRENQKTLIFVVLISFIISLGTCGTTILQYYFMEFITKTLPPEGSGKTSSTDTIALTYFISLLSIVIVSSILYVIQSVVMTKVAQRAGKHLRKDLYFKLLELKLQYFDSTPSGDIMSRLTNDINNITMALTQNVTQFFINFTQMLFFLVALLLFAPILGVIAICFVPLQLSVVYVLFKKAQPNFYKKQVALGDINGFIEETISGQKIINNFNKQELIVKQFSVKNEEMRKITYKTDLLSSLSNPWNTMMSNTLIATLFVVSMVMGIKNFEFGGIVHTLSYNKELDAWVTNPALVTSLLTIVMAFARNFSNPIYQIFQLLNQLQAAIAGANRVMVVKDQINEVLPEQENVDINNVKGHIEFKNLIFSYNGKTNVLKNIDLDVKPGQVVGIVGPTGSGKTTIINLLTKFYDVINPKSDILIDGISIKNITKHSLRDEVSIVLQDTFVFGESIYENMRYAKPDATDEEIHEAAKKANAHHFIMSLEKGYDTILENNADDISQGQRQLLAIARAFLKQSSILILDEATSSVDTKTEKDIQSGMIELSKGKTTFMIAHRLSTIKHADIIVVLKDGSILEKGNHQQLLKKGGFYANMYNSKLNTPEDI